MFTLAYCSVHLCESRVCPHGSAQVFHSSAYRQSHACQLRYNGCMDTTAVPNFTFMWVQMHGLKYVCIYGHSTRVSNWEQQMCPCNGCIPTDMSGIDMTLTWVFAEVCPCEQDLRYILICKNNFFFPNFYSLKKKKLNKLFYFFVTQVLLQ